MCRGKREGWNRGCASPPPGVCVCVCVCMCVCLWACVLNERNRKGTRCGCLPWPSGTVGSQSPGLVAWCCWGRMWLWRRRVDRQQGCVFWGSLQGKRIPPGTRNSPGAEDLVLEGTGMGKQGMGMSCRRTGHRGTKLHVGCVGLATSLPPDCCPPHTPQSSWSRDLLLLRVCRVCYRENLWTNRVARIPRPSGFLGTSSFSWLSENFRENRCSLPQRNINEGHPDSGWKEFHVLSRDPQKSLKKALSPPDITFIFTKALSCKGRTLTYSGSQNQQECSGQKQVFLFEIPFQQWFLLYSLCRASWGSCECKMCPPSSTSLYEVFRCPNIISFSATWILGQNFFSP